MCVYIYIYIHTYSIYIYIHTYIHRDGSRFSNIRLVDLIIEYRLGCAIIFLKVYQGLTIKTVRWREGRSDLSLARSGHCSVVTKLYHLNAFLSLVFKKMLAIKKYLGAKDNSFQYMLAVICSV